MSVEQKIFETPIILLTLRIAKREVYCFLHIGDFGEGQEWTEQHRIHEAENGGIGSNPKRQHHYDSQGGARLLQSIRAP
jgi:hypothetical protein